MNTRKTLITLAIVLLAAAFLFPVVSAQENWEVPDDWDTDDYLPTPSPNPAQRQYSSFVASIFIAVGVFSLLPIILAVFVFSKGQIDTKTVIIIISAILIMSVCMLILFNFIGATNNAMGV